MRRWVMPQRKTYEWFVEPRDSRTNERIVSALRDWGKEDDVIIGMEDDAGHTHNVYRVPYALVAVFGRNRRQAGLDFLVYNRRGGHKKVRRWKFL